MAATRLVVWLSTCAYLTNGLTFLSRPQQKPNSQNADVSQCPDALVEPPSSCAAERVAARISNETDVVLTMFTLYPNVAEIVRQLEYHFLLGADLAIIYDNGCPSESAESKRSCDALEDALQPYVDNGLVKLRKEYQCILGETLVPPEKLPIGGSGLALQLVVMNEKLHPKPGTLMVSLDDDEYIVMQSDNQDLRDLRSMLLNGDQKTAGVRWRMYGSSGHVCQPTGSLLRHFTKRIKTDLEATDKEKEDALKEAKEHRLNPPYTTHSGKFIAIWESADQISKCDTHTCGPQRYEEFGRQKWAATPDPVTDMAFIAHFAYQSEQHWAAKLARRSVPVGVYRSGTVPQRYNEVAGTSGWKNLLKKIDDVNDQGLRSCMADMFGPKPDNVVLQATTHCMGRPAELPKCNALSNTKPMRIAVAFYGAQRSTAYTARSIQKNLLEPLDLVSNGARDVFVHALLDKTATRTVADFTGERTVDVCPDDLLMLSPCEYETHDQENVDREQHLNALAESARWDAEHKNGLGSAPEISKVDIRLNILRSRWSMTRVAELIAAREAMAGVRYTHAVMARADAGFAVPIVWQPIEHSEISWYRVPNSQHWMGLNDRFAYGERNAVVDVLLREYDSMNKAGAFYSTGSEGKMCDYIRQQPVRVGLTPLCLVRVRENGDIEAGDFHVRGTSRPEECISAGLNFKASETDDDDACAKVDGAEVASWGWALPKLDEVLKFIHIPKNGGTSVEAVGSAYGAKWGKQAWSSECAFGCGDTQWHSCSPWHMPMATFHEKKDGGKLGSAMQERFCVVRDPLKKAISQYAFTIQADPTLETNIVNGIPGTCDAASLNKHIQTLLGGAEEALLRVQKDMNVSAEALGDTRTCTTCAAVGDCHWLPQWVYVKDQCDHVLHLETLGSDFDALMERFAPTVSAGSVIPRNVIANHNELSPKCNTLTVDDLDSTSLDLLRRIYAEDFKMFGYDA